VRVFLGGGRKSVVCTRVGVGAVWGGGGGGVFVFFCSIIICIFYYVLGGGGGESPGAPPPPPFPNETPGTVLSSYSLHWSSSLAFPTTGLSCSCTELGKSEDDSIQQCFLHS